MAEEKSFQKRSFAHRMDLCSQVNETVCSQRIDWLEWHVCGESVSFL